MNKTYLISVDTLKTFCQGALGAMTFGAYHQYTTNQIMELNNEKVDIKHKSEMNIMENKHQIEINEMKNQHKLLNEKLENLERIVSQTKYWW